MPKAAGKITDREDLKFTEGRCEDCIGGKSSPSHRVYDFFPEKYTSSATVRGIEGKLFPRQNLQGIKFLPTEDIPTAKARCQSFFLRKEFTHAYLRHGKSHAQLRVSKCLGLMTSSQIYNFNLLICHKQGCIAANSLVEVYN